jgi:hypothetical protein
MTPTAMQAIEAAPSCVAGGRRRSSISWPAWS